MGDRMRRYGCVVIAALAVCAGAGRPAASELVSDEIERRMERLQFGGELSIGGAPIAARALLPELYAARAFRPLWSEEGRIAELLELIETAPEHGLLPRDYLEDQLESLLSRPDRTDPEVAELDILLTESFARYGFHRTFGKVEPAHFDANINFRRAFMNGADPVRALEEAIESPVPLQRQIDEALRPGLVYRAVQQALADHREIQARGGWPAVPEGPTLREGDVDPRVRVLRRRLEVSGDLPSTALDDGERFDAPLRAAVETFQLRHALEPDGVVGPTTLAALRIPVEDRIDQLRLSLERIRWLQLEDRDDLVIVNIARFALSLIEDGEVVFATRVMVGSEYRQTPVFRGELRYLERNPTWTVPPTILREDVLPAIRRDPGYLVERNMVVLDRAGHRVDPGQVDWRSPGRSFPYTIRQEPGPTNALGRIKFIFPNPHFVFLHDTPSRGLFDRAERAFSAGCIRVEQPLELAARLAAMDGQPRWSEAALVAAVDSERTQRIHFSTSLPVLIVYLTASTSPGQPVFFGRDLYGRDRRLLPILDGPVTISRPSRDP
ncbi:MAG: L,D-transpeptidase family protein [Pseudomonadales bacterium]|jgi:murein L,D-transpeptidase YcbB/YkuD|nr:L,D-transpeptidase family protein [Pseudomonadales bacterium]